MAFEMFGEIETASSFSSLGLRVKFPAYSSESYQALPGCGGSLREAHL